MSLRITVFKMIDYETLNDKTHRSISGGIASHSFDKIDEFKCPDSETVLKKINEQYNLVPFIFDDRLELQLSDSESLSFYIEEILETDNAKLKSMFPNLEEY